MNKKIIVILIAIVIIALPFIFLKKSNKVEYIKEPVKTRTITEIVEATGTVQPVNTVEIGAQVSGMINEIYVDYNSEVKKGHPKDRAWPAIIHIRKTNAFLMTVI